MRKKIANFVILFTLLIHLQLGTAQSVYEKNFKKDGLILSCGVGLVVASEIMINNIDPITTTEIIGLSKYQINKFDRNAVSYYSPQLDRVSDVLLGACILSPVMLFSDGQMMEYKNTILLMHLESMLLTSFFTTILKTSGRIRPYFYNRDVPLQKKLGLKNEARVSFPSRHTSLAFASAVLFSKVFCDFHPASKYKSYIWAGSLSAASVVGYLRYKSGNHFPTDIIAGAIIGSAMGYFIPYFHKNKSLKNISFHPSHQMQQFMMTYKFRF